MILAATIAATVVALCGAVVLIWSGSNQNNTGSVASAHFQVPTHEWIDKVRCLETLDQSLAIRDPLVRSGCTLLTAERMIYQTINRAARTTFIESTALSIPPSANTERYVFHFEAKTEQEQACLAITFAQTLITELLRRADKKTQSSLVREFQDTKLIWNTEGACQDSTIDSGVVRSARHAAFLKLLTSHE